MSDWDKYWQSLPVKVNLVGMLYDELKKLFEENKAMKEGLDDILTDLGSAAYRLGLTIQKTEALKKEEESK